MLINRFESEMTNMNHCLVGLLSVFLLMTAGVKSDSTTAAIGKCAVCQIQRMDSLEKPLIAQSEYKGQEYRFCSDACKTQFDINSDYYIEPLLPRPAPDFSLTTLSGNQDSLAKHRGKVVLIDFWASWCAPCVKSMKDLQSIYTEFRADSLVIIGITLDSIGTAQTIVHLQKHQITYPILYESRSSPTWLAYKMKSLPSLYLINCRGQIVRQWRGLAEKSEIEAAVRLLLEESESDKK